MWKKIPAFLLCCFSLSFLRAQKFENLAMTPPMGWNSWNTFAVHINEKLVMDMADAMVASGMKDAGYIYLVLDDGWMAMERDSLGNLVPDPEKFPHGIKAVADYIHAKGLKFGLYNCAGTKTCAGYPGTHGYEYQDARNYAAWGIDYLKFDWCNTNGIDAKEAYTKMSQALRQAGRPIIFSLCEWGANKPWLWASPVGQLWRTTGDIGNVFDGTKNQGTWHSNGVMTIVDMQNGLQKYAGPGHWNDPDMLEVGNGMTPAEDRTHFSMWCMLAAPLIAGNDLRKMSPRTAAILTDKELIAIDQDPLGAEGIKYAVRDSVEIWARPLQGGDWAICFLNRASAPRPFSFQWDNESITDSVADLTLDSHSAAYNIHNLWLKKVVGRTSKPFSATLPAHDVIVLRLMKEKK